MEEPRAASSWNLKVRFNQFLLLLDRREERARARGECNFVALSGHDSAARTESLFLTDTSDFSGDGLPAGIDGMIRLFCRTAP